MRIGKSENKTETETISLPDCFHKWLTQSELNWYKLRNLEWNPGLPNWWVGTQLLERSLLPIRVYISRKLTSGNEHRYSSVRRRQPY